MLRWDPDSRGGKLDRGAPGRDKCWTLLDNILNSPVSYNSWMYIHAPSFQAEVVIYL